MTFPWKITWWAALVGMGVAPLASAQREQWLNYRTSSEGRGYRYLDLDTNAPPGVALPKLNGPAYFARWTTPMDPGGGRWICLDRTSRSGLWDRLFVDRNGDGRLDDEKPIKTWRRDQSNAYFDRARIVFKSEDGPVVYHLACRFIKYDDNRIYFLASSAGWYEGRVDFAGKKRRVQLVDENVNGTFNDLVPASSEADAILVDGLNGGQRYLGRLLEVDGRIYHIEVARDGAFLKLWEAKDLTFGKVRVPSTVSELTALGQNGQFIREPSSGEFTLPAGKYRVYGWKIDRKDDRGQKWQVTGYSVPDTASFEVSVSNPSTLEVGEPIRAVWQASDAAGNQVTFSLRFRGLLGESIEFTRGGETPRGPRLTVTNADGSFRHTGNFEFG